MTIREHQHIDEWVEAAVDYLDGRVDPETRAAIERHLAVCPDCTRRLTEQHRVTHLLQNAPLYPPPEDLEYRVLGEFVFPSPGTVPVFAESGRPGPSWSSRLFARLRPWIPVSVAVVALLAAVIGYGVVRSGLQGAVPVAEDARTYSSASLETGAPEGSPDQGDVNQLAAPATGLAPDTETTTRVGASTTATSTAPTTATATTVAGTTERKQMIKGLETAESPAYVVFLPEVSDTDGEQTAVRAEQAAEVEGQLAQFSGLEPLDRELWLDGPTYAAYVPRIDCEELVDLVRSIGTSLGLSVMLTFDPPELAGDRVARLLAAKARFPVLEASRAPQPATWGFNFTTSTLAPEAGGSEGGGQATTTTLPDEGGKHILLIIYIQQGLL